ncbi:MAG: transcriptional regulator [Planctomycetota bacterium]|nr:MAG: transcriptional regulator [Planctomycetota bacterium]
MNTPDSIAPVPMLDVNRQNGPLSAQFERAIGEVARSGAFVHGPACQRFEDQMAAYCGVAHAIGCASGSDALLLALMALEVGPGDEVILPSFTFFATAGAVWRLGARPVFADILPETFNIDPADVARKITPATKAVLPVHLFGQCADMEALRAACGDLPIIEDAAQAIGAEYRGVKAGALGLAGCFSFYPTKNLGAWGDAGLVTTGDAVLAAKLRVLRDHGQQPRYHHSLVGLNSRLDAVQAAVLSVKLAHLDGYAAARDRHARRYAAQFARLGIDRQLLLPRVDERCACVWNQFTVRVTGGRRDELLKWLSDRKIGAAVYYPVPLHLQSCFAALGYRRGDLPASEQAADDVLSLPIYGEMTAAEQDRVIAALAEFCGAAKPAARAA